MIIGKKYKRCPVCKELVIDVDNCANCRDRDPSYSRKTIHDGAIPVITLDMQEGNSGLWGDD